MKNKKYNNPPFINSYKLIKQLKDQDFYPYPSIGIYENIKHKKYIIKTLNFIFKHTFFSQLLNESKIYKNLSIALNANNLTNLKVPKVEEIIITNNYISLPIEYLEGKELSTFSNKEIATRLDYTLKALSKITHLDGVNKKTHFNVLITFPFYLLSLCIKDWKNILTYLHLTSIFIKNYCTERNYLYCFSHRDLHDKNILVKNNKNYLIDLEVGSLAEKQTDLAITVRLLSEKLDDEILKLIKNNVNSQSEKNLFIGLLIYYTFQIMAIRPKNETDFIVAKNFIKNHIYSIINDISKKTEYKRKLTTAEILFKAITNTIYYTKIFFKVKDKKSSIILCYHSIDDSGWRYSTNINDFESHLDFLVKNYRFASLDQVIKNKPNKNTISLTFDDGYKDFITTALPIMQRKGIKGTLFILGNFDLPNRDTLNNNKQLLTIEDIKKIKKAGWDIGFHTDTHADLKLSNKDQLINEIVIGKQSIEKKLGFKLRYLAYPMGRYNKQVLDVVNRSTFEAAFTTDARTINYTSLNKFLIPRIVIDGSINLIEFKGLLSPMGLEFSKSFDDLLKLKDSLSYRLKNIILTYKDYYMNNERRV